MVFFAILNAEVHNNNNCSTNVDGKSILVGDLLENISLISFIVLTILRKKPFDGVESTIVD